MGEALPPEWPIHAKRPPKHLTGCYNFPCNGGRRVIGHGRKARGASGAALVISLVFLSGVSQAVGFRAGGLTDAAGGSLSTASASALAHSPACAPAPRGVHDFAPAVGPGRTVALTFDDGPGPSTKAILSILADEHVPATFFNLGSSEALRPADVVREVAGG